jgi:8-amino-7-oxononanoate synthase
MESVAAFLKQREDQGLMRALCPATARGGGRREEKGASQLDLCSNDYLGLSRHPRLCAAAAEALQRYGTGSGASRLMSGDLELHHRLEERTAALKGKPAALVFNSGYQANVGIISALCTREDAILCDRLSHASILDGARLAGAKLLRFKHNDPDHLDTLLTKTAVGFRRRLVISESLFSMDGDLAPLTALAERTRAHGALLMVDEAHATGVTGPNGSGLVAALGLNDQVDLVMGTYSKALGGFGGYLACSAAMKAYLVNTARSFIYSTALPPAVIAANLAALDVLVEEPHRRVVLQKRTAWFREQLQTRGLALCGSTQIVPWLTGDVQTTRDRSRALRKRGFYALAVRPPTVAPGKSRLRFSLCFDHRREDLESLLHAIDEVRHV